MSSVLNILNEGRRSLVMGAQQTQFVLLQPESFKLNYNNQKRTKNLPISV